RDLAASGVGVCSDPVARVEFGTQSKGLQRVSDARGRGLAGGGSARRQQPDRGEAGEKPRESESKLEQKELLAQAQRGVLIPHEGSGLDCRHPQSFAQAVREELPAGGARTAEARGIVLE